MGNVSEFYDQFSEQQVKTGINRRHRSIDRWLCRFGIHPGDRVLEIGCGVGTQTELLCRHITEGQVVAMDISAKSVELAKKRLAGTPHCRFFTGDILTLDLQGPFDIILLPDVLEHIPLDQHPALFKKLSTLLAADGYILIHIPDPYYLQSLIDQGWKGLQIIDQPIYTDRLAGAVYPAGLYIEHLESYDLHVENHDYQVIKLRKTREKNYPAKVHYQSVMSRVLKKLGLGSDETH